MTTEGEPAEHRFAPPHVEATGSSTSSPGVVLCLFDGTAAGADALQTAAIAAAAAGRRLVVAHREKTTSGFWAAAFTGYGACLGPPERLMCTSAAGAFATTVEELFATELSWDFATFTCGSARGLRDLVALHRAAVVVLDGGGRLARRLRRRNAELTVLTLT